MGWDSFTPEEDSWEELLVAEEVKNIEVGEQTHKTHDQEGIDASGVIREILDELLQLKQVRTLVTNHDTTTPTITPHVHTWGNTYHLETTKPMSLK